MTLWQAFAFEYDYQRYQGRSVIFSAWRGIIAVFEPVPF